MGRAYVLDYSGTNTDANQLGVVTGGATIRPAIYDLIISSRAAPADQACGYKVQRATTAGSGGTAKTPQALDPADPSSAVTSQQLPSTPATLTANAILLMINGNLRSIIRWTAQGEKRMLKIPATAANGLAIVAVSPTSGFQVETTCYFDE